jgi:hypothetical protein
MESLGMSLLKDKENQNFDLILDDGVSRKLMTVNKLVLTNSSLYFRDRLGGQFYFCFIWTIPLGFIHAAANIITYMYTRSLKDISLDVNIRHMQQLCVTLQMPILYKLVSQIAYKCNCIGTEKNISIKKYFTRYQKRNSFVKRH